MNELKLTRLDLDGAGSPDRLIRKIFELEPSLSYPIPVTEIATALDIQEIGELDTLAFEGSLLIGPQRRYGSILVNKKAGPGRRRFTIGHELGHWLIPMHKPVKGDQFLCSRDDMRMWNKAEQNTYARMEVEANMFSALLLMPPHLLRKYLAKKGDPSLTHVVALHEDFIVSKDAAARAYAQYFETPVATVVVHKGKVERIYKSMKFPFISAGKGSDVPKASVYWRTKGSKMEMSEIVEISAGNWLDSQWGKKLPLLYEQVLHQQMDYALILLWPELPDEDDEHDPDENLTSKQRYAKQRERWER
jgi:hypothetical protein